MVRNNLIIDPTDVGIVLFGAPGSLVEGNHVASVSREAFGGVALVDAMDLYAVSGARATRDVATDYRGSRVQGNRLSALGAHMHIGVAVGPPIWFGPDWLGARTLGVAVTNNSLDGEAFGYGIVANGCDQVRIEGNASSAQHGGSADGVGGVAAVPRAFLYNPATTTNPVALQGEFVADASLTSLLRLGGCPKNGAGFRVCDYTNSEAQAIVRLAYIEILGREPDAAGAGHFIGRVLNEHLTGDALRRELMASPEFKQRYPNVAPSAMQAHRQAVWETALFELIAVDLKSGKPWPAARNLFDRALTVLAKSSGAPPIAPPAACDPQTQPAPAWGEKNGGCLPSCGGLAGTSSSPTPCAQNGKVDAGAAYDVPFCCKDVAGLPPPAAVCNAVTQPAPAWGEKNGQCLSSCGGLGGTSSFATPCAQNGKVDAGAAYDVPFCCQDAAPPPPPPPAPGPGASAGNTLTKGQTLQPGQSRLSTDGRFRLVYQFDGNLVLYRVANGSALWSSNTGGSSAGQTAMQGDGNLVVYDQGGVARWASYTGTSATRLVVQNDGNLVIRDAADHPLWDSKTGGQ